VAPLIEHELPNGTMEDIRNEAGRPVFTAYRWSGPHAPAPRFQDAGLTGTLHVQSRDGQPQVRTRADPSVAFRNLGALAGGLPLVARWSGELLAPIEGEYVIELYTDGAAKLEVDGQGLFGEPANQPALGTLSDRRHLLAGWHPIKLD
jgi:hypothetical protein